MECPTQKYWGAQRLGSPKCPMPVFFEFDLQEILNNCLEKCYYSTGNMQRDISQVVSCILAIGYLVKVNEPYKIKLKDIKLNKSTAGRIIKIGLPTGIQNMTISLSNVLVQSSVNQFGASAMAGFGAYMKIDGFNILPVLSFSMAITTFVGQNYGANKIDRVKKGMWISNLVEK